MRPTICITAKQFNADKFKVSETKIFQTKSNMKLKFSEISYLNDKDEPCDLFITLPKVQTWGPYPQYSYNSTNKNPQNISGYTISYTNSETYRMFNEIKKICSNKNKKWQIKPVFSKNKNNNHVAYFKLKMNGTDISTEFFTDKKCTMSINVKDIISKYGNLTPMIHLRSIYFGSHGNTDFNASLQINIVKAIFQKIEANEPNFNFNDSDDSDHSDIGIDSNNDETDDDD